MRLRYLVQTKEDLALVVNYLKEESVVAVDVETNGKFSQYELSLVGISIGFDLFAVYIPLTHLEGDQLPLPYVLEELRPFLEDPSSNYVFHNAKFDEKVFHIYDIECQGSGDDTYVLAWLIDEQVKKGSHGLKQLVKKYLGVKMETYEDVIGRSKVKRGTPRDFNFARVSLDNAVSYAGDDAYYTLQLYRRLSEQVSREKLGDAYRNIERPLLRVVRQMEYTGVLVDREMIDHAAVHYPKLMDQIAEEILEEIGEPINIDSGKQLGEALFDKLEIGNNPAKTKTGQYCTDKKALEKYAARHPIVEKVLRRKRIKKTSDVFVEGLIPHIQHGRVHAGLNPSGTVTGRFSSSKPNLQQIQGDEIEEIRVRDFFKPSPGYVFIVGDYGQVELRVMAHSAEDEAAIRAFESGRDFHTETARIMFELPEDVEPTARQRFYAKGLNFGIPYGRGPVSVGEVLGITPYCKDHTCDQCAACFIDRWWQAFSRTKEFKDKEFLPKVRKLGYMRTIAGRKRRLPNIRSNDYKIRGAAERQAFNTLCQGSSADIIKLGMVQAAPVLKTLKAQMLIQIHDELLVEAPIEKAEKTVEALHEIMEHPLNGKNPLILPLKFEPKIVERWSQAK